MTVDLTHFDPDAPCTADDGLFGLPHDEDDARVVVIPVPWEPTTSYRRGTAAAPGRMMDASHQVDLFDRDLGDAWREGIAMAPVDRELVALNERACDAALPVIESGGPGGIAELEGLVGKVDLASETMNERVSEMVAAVYDRGAIPAILGGDHSVPFGAIREAVRRHPAMGVLHFDAHLDLRVAYQGFAWSHASIMDNVLTWSGLKGSLVQVGVRDFGRAEWAKAESDPRVHAFPWSELSWALSCGASWEAVARPIIAALPDEVWISFDIDGLEPALCPETGTPVPGGLGWDHTLHLLRLLRESGKRVVGFDLVEVGDSEWDAIVGARLLYQLACTAILTSRGRPASP